ncbi:mitotic checkpoint serine/threonine-protein kinase BUB1 isoform X3 [Benincasa hispida]|uniref:mitotic checkpoint serine/threonine-protein kinase BUB1 isoform X3 n=1 Tax=Benincasa hispida TaxID=102211 RepID=UPI00190154D7|nr:mitotic checkpoint serine/threonine-protein kinase BUB1 isoform X3 [Benincasa hispida]
MAIFYPDSQISTTTASAQDPLLPWLWSIKDALENSTSGNVSGPELAKLLSDCIENFSGDVKYKNDVRFLKIWFLSIGMREDFETGFKELLEQEICIGHSLLYIWLAVFLESKGRLNDANIVYELGLMRNAEPLEWLKKAKTLFIDRISELVNTHSMQVNDVSESTKFAESYINPWSSSTMNDLLSKISPKIMKYDGYHSSTKAYSKKMTLKSLRNSSRNKIIEIGGKKYEIKGCAGTGGFAQVYRSYLDSNPDDVVALKRSSFGCAHAMYLYSDYSILICDFLAHGTLQDAINSYVVLGKTMEEVLCIYYTIEMLYMLETLHSIGIIHGDFKPDNLLIRYAGDNLTEDEFQERSGPWQDQGLCLVDWGRGIDLHLFPENVEFKGDCRTSGFRCPEMLENKPWKFQVDIYGFCVVVHTMLHGSYMEVEKKPSSDGDFVYLPKTSFKRYWNIELWKNLFTKLLNITPGDYNKELIQSIRKSFQDYMCSNPQLIRKLKELLAKQRASLCNA